MGGPFVPRGGPRRKAARRAPRPHRGVTCHAARLFLRTDLGGRYAYESRGQYYATATQPVGDIADVDFPAPGSAWLRPP